jgi:hypothetical protein
LVLTGFLGETMLQSHGWLSAVLLSALLGACSGKTEGGGTVNGDATPAQQPATSPTSSEPRVAEPDRHLLMVVELAPKQRAARVLSSQTVELPLPKRRGPAQSGAWRAEVLSADGKVLFSAPLANAATMHADVPDEKTGQLRSVTVEKDVTAVTLRVPWLAGAREVRVVNAEGGEQELGRVAYPQVTP